MTKRSAPPSVESFRINRFLSMCGVSSRRKAEGLVEEGRVAVDGKVIRDLATRVTPGRNRITVDGREVAVVHEPIYLAMNKPKDTITTLSDERGRHTVMELVRTKQRVYPIGRLDRNTTGVLLLTNDGTFAHQMMHPKTEVPKSYLVTLDEPVTREHLRALARGVELEDGTTAPAEVTPIAASKGKEVGITIHEGRNRQVRRMFEHFGYTVAKLDRVAYGPVTTEGLARGATRRLAPAELRRLRQMAGMAEPQSRK
jgi:23S rRNA pseudouridine2605 synthase